MGKDPREVRNKTQDWALPLCEQAQADGVPCTELGKKCETCEHAVRTREPRESTPDSTHETDSTGRP